MNKQDMHRSRCDARGAQARSSASNNKKQEPGNMADLGKKYCVNCLADVTNLRLRCTDCPDIELCPECFSAGAEIGNHRRWHGYQQVDGGRFSLWGPEAEGGWTSREEQSLLDAIEQYGFGNWVVHFLSCLVLTSFISVLRHVRFSEFSVKCVENVKSKSW